MADDTKLPFYGLIRLVGRLRDVRFEAIFVVSQISEDAILGMPFLSSEGCTMSFEKPLVSLRGKELPCTDKYGRLLVCRV